MVEVISCVDSVEVMDCVAAATWVVRQEDYGLWVTWVCFVVWVFVGL